MVSWANQLNHLNARTTGLCVCGCVACSRRTGWKIGAGANGRRSRLLACHDAMAVIVDSDRLSNVRCPRHPKDSKHHVSQSCLPACEIQPSTNIITAAAGKTSGPHFAPSVSPSEPGPSEAEGRHGHTPKELGEKKRGRARKMAWHCCEFPPWPPHPSSRALPFAVVSWSEMVWVPLMLRSFQTPVL